jgi:hypothetical protein
MLIAWLAETVVGQKGGMSSAVLEFESISLQGRVNSELGAELQASELRASSSANRFMRGGAS